MFVICFSFFGRIPVFSHAQVWPNNPWKLELSHPWRYHYHAHGRNMENASRCHESSRVIPEVAWTSHRKPCQKHSKKLVHCKSMWLTHQFWQGLLGIDWLSALFWFKLRNLFARDGVQSVFTRCTTLIPWARIGNTVFSLYQQHNGAPSLYVVRQTLMITNDVNRSVEARQNFENYESPTSVLPRQWYISRNTLVNKVGEGFNFQKLWQL